MAEENKKPVAGKEVKSATKVESKPAAPKAQAKVQAPVAKKVADRIIFMDAGQIVEENTPENFFKNPESDRLKLFLEQILSH